MTLNKMYSEEDIKFKTPFSMMVAGPSGSGKTYFVRELLKNHELLISGERGKLKVIWCYGQWQNLYNEFVENCEIDYHDGLASEEMIKETSPDVIIVDDLMNEVADDSKMGNLFTKGSHHLNINVIFITQNLFHQGKQMRNISLSSHYFVIMKNSRDRSQIDVLGRQMKKRKALEEAFADATKSSYGYLVIDFRQDTPEALMLRTDIFPIKDKYSPTVYVQR